MQFNFITAMSKHYYSYLLRIFRPGEADCMPWKITLQNTRTLEQLDFGDLEALQQFLNRLINSRVKEQNDSSHGVQHPDTAGDG
jgi:hypothetical protein